MKVWGGFVPADSNTVWIYPATAEWEASFGELVNHELTHTVSSVLLDSGRYTAELGTVQQELDSFRMNSFSSLSDIVADRLDYALTVSFPHELVSVFLSEVQVRNELQTLNPEAFDKLSQIFRKLFKEYHHDQHIQNTATRGNQGGSSTDVSSVAQRDATQASELPTRGSTSNNIQRNSSSSQGNLPSAESATLKNLSQLHSFITGLKTANAFHKALNSYLRDAVKDFNPRVKVEVTEMTGGYAKYNLSNNTITFSPVIHDPSKSDAAKLKLVNHELLHALTEASLQSANPKFTKAIDHLYQMMDQVMQAWDQNSTDPQLNSVLNIIKDLPREQALSEFVAYGMSEPKMAQLIDASLKPQNIDGLTLSKRVSKAFDYFIAAVYSALGLKKIGYKAFAQTVHDLMDSSADLPVTPIQAVYSQSAMKSVQENIQRGRDAMNKAIVNKADVKRAMYRNDIGWVDFVWGDTGIIKANGKTKGAMGISHIIEARMRKDGMSYDEVVKMLTNATVDTIAKGEVIREIAREKTQRLTVLHDKTIIHLIKQVGSNAWLLSGYEENQMVNQSRGATTSDLRTNSPILSRTDVGASDKTTVSHSNPDHNPNTRFSQVFDEMEKLSASDMYRELINQFPSAKEHLSKISSISIFIAIIVNKCTLNLQNATTSNINHH